MAKIYVVKTLRGLEPAWDSDEEHVKKLKLGETYAIEIKRPRNIKFHKKYWALVNLVFSNMPDDFELRSHDGEIVDKINTAEALHYHIKMQCGLVERTTSLGGKVIWRVKSIAFQKMDEAEFDAFYQRAVDVIVKYFLPVDADLLLAEVAGFS